MALIKHQVPNLKNCLRSLDPRPYMGITIDSRSQNSSAISMAEHEHDDDAMVQNPPM